MILVQILNEIDLECKLSYININCIKLLVLQMQIPSVVNQNLCNFFSTWKYTITKTDVNISVHLTTFIGHVFEKNKIKSNQIRLLDVTVRNRICPERSHWPHALRATRQFSHFLTNEGNSFSILLIYVFFFLHKNVQTLLHGTMQRCSEVIGSKIDVSCGIKE